MKLLKDRDRASAAFTPEGRQKLREAMQQANRDTVFADYDLAGEIGKGPFVKERVYLRFGDVPGSGRSGGLQSRYLSSGEDYERGVSVFSGRLTAEGHYLIDITSTDLHCDLIVCCTLDDRPAFLVRGTPLKGNRSSRGQSGEPLLKKIASAEPLKEGCVVGATVPSFALEDWNRRRGTLPGEPEIPAGGLGEGGC